MKKRVFSVGHSLKRKFVLPLLIGGGLLGILAVTLIYQQFQQQLQQSLRADARLVANAVNTAAESISHRGELQRVVMALGAEPDVMMIMVVGGNPSHVLASTSGAWLGKPLTGLPGPEVGADLMQAIQSKRSHEHFNHDQHLYDFSLPLLLSASGVNGGAADVGAVMVHIDTRPAEARMRALVFNFSFAWLAGLAALCGLGWWLVRRLVLQPLALISHNLGLRRKGVDDTSVSALQSHAEDEIGLLAQQLYIALDSNDRALSRLEARQLALDEHSIVSISNAQGKITYANDKYCAVAKYSRQELLGKDCLVGNSGLDSEEVMQHLRDTILSGQVWQGELKDRAKDGSHFWVNTTIIPTRSQDGAATQYIRISTDITANKQSSEKLAIARDVAEAANLAKSQFLANISHEIRTPMNAVLGLTELVLQTELTSRQQNLLRIAHRSGATLMGLLNEILDYAKIEAGCLKVEQMPVNLRVLVQAVGEMFGAQADVKGIRLKVQLAPEVPAEVLGDPQRLSQVLNNLVGYAIKFTEQGEVCIEVAAGPNDPGENVMDLLFSVRDTGIGMTVEQLARLFQPFAQADSSATRRYGGTGLGLSISEHLVNLMGGKIDVSSAFGEGTRFAFGLQLPVWRRTGESHNAAVMLADVLAPSDLQFDGAHVLLVDDHDFNQLVASEYLKGHAVQTTVANNGSEALDLVRLHTFDLILMDINMPVMDGIEATRCIRAVATGNATPILAMTADITDKDRQRCLSAGMQDFVGKPIDPARLAMALQKWLPAHLVQTAARHEIDAQAAVRDELSAETFMPDRNAGHQALLAVLVGLTPVLEQRDLVPREMLHTLCQMAEFDLPGQPVARMIACINEFEYDLALRTAQEIGVLLAEGD